MRRSSRQAQKRDSDGQNTSPNEISGARSGVVPRTPYSINSRKRAASVSQTRSNASNSEDGDYLTSDRELLKKKRKIAPRRKITQKDGHQPIFQQLFSADRAASGTLPCQLPRRAHSIDYHRPLLLDSREGRAALLEWFDRVSSRRSMPWRKPWIDPRRHTDDPALLRQKLERRAYEVWISEIMLQQTRVAVVIDYWNRWFQKWPTIHELADADPDSVLAAWRGLGYYSRATRIHEAAKIVCKDPIMNGLLPSAVDELVAKVPGVGRYTAGAISAIVFGKAAPMVDGNVLRVLSRQLGILANVKSSKSVIDLLWAAADSLVKAVAEDCAGDEISGPEAEQMSDRPGRWGQALMELGSTVCAPKPNCEACPISGSCRAYGEGLQLAATRGLAPTKANYPGASPSSTPDIEDLCNFCESFEDIAQDDGDKEVEVTAVSKNTPPVKDMPRAKRQATLSAFFTRANDNEQTALPIATKLSPGGLAVIVNHARKFPVKVVKKAVREEETLVCAMRRSDGQYLIHRRPQKGLLAGLWEFPSWIVPGDHERTATAYRRAAELFASGVLDPTLKQKSLLNPKLKYVGRLGSVPWLFSHLKLTMHVFLFEFRCSEDEFDAPLSVDDRWSTSVETESMGTGMRKCWELVRGANGD